MYFKITGKISNIEIIAVNKAIYEIRRLIKIYGKGRWRKLKGIVLVELSDGFISKAEIHWYEAHGTGKKEIKIKKLVK